MNNRVNAMLLRLSALASLAVLTSCGNHQSQEVAPITVYFTEVSATNSTRVRDFTGTVHAHVESDLGFRAGGKIVRRTVEVGDRVKAGQLVATLDPSDYDLGVLAAADQVKQAKAQAQLDSSDKARFGRLTEDGSIATADHERQSFRSDASDAKLDQSQHQLQVAKNLASYASLVAPFDGVITSLHAEVGQVVGEGQPVVSIAEDGGREIVVDLPEGMMSEIRSLQAQAIPWQGGGTPTGLKLREVSPAANPQGRTFRVKYTVLQPTDKTLETWALGSTAELTFVYPAQASVVLPVSAIVSTGVQTIVWSVDASGGRLVALPVKVIASESDSVSVQGLPAHTRVVSVGAQKLDAGMRVRAVERKPDEAMKVARSAT